LDGSRSSRSGLTPGTPNADRKTTTYNEQDRKIERSKDRKIERSKDRKIYSNGIEIDEVKRTQQVMDIPAELQQVMDIPAEPRGKTNGPRHGAGKL
jgi:hypothetical protein